MNRRGGTHANVSNVGGPARGAGHRSGRLWLTGIRSGTNTRMRQRFRAPSKMERKRQLSFIMLNFSLLLVRLGPVLKPVQRDLPPDDPGAHGLSDPRPPCPRDDRRLPGPWGRGMTRDSGAMRGDGGAGWRRLRGSGEARNTLNFCRCGFGAFIWKISLNH